MQVASVLGKLKQPWQSPTKRGPYTIIYDASKKIIDLKQLGTLKKDKGKDHCEFKKSPWKSLQLQPQGHSCQDPTM